MRSVRVVVSCVVVLVCACGSLTADSLRPSVRTKRLTVLGTLTDEMNREAGTATSVWSLQLNPVIMLDGQQISSLEIKATNPQKLTSLQDKFVQATGKLTLIRDTETAQAPVFELWSIKEHKSKGLQP